MRFKHVLCPVDFSASSRQALDAAVDLAISNDAPLTLLHVFRPPLSDGPAAQISGEAIQAMVDGDDQLMAVWTANATKAGVKHVHSTIVTGVPWDEVVQLVDRDRSIDLVVMGTHGRTGLAHALLGSVAERVVRHARCTVLIVR
ncbi:MAG TPA: universal stress protein [Kofleriaceae bacterium]|jgi:nucleotide-binding universal stress UspA family protein